MTAAARTSGGFIAAAFLFLLLASGARAEYGPPRLASVFPPGAKQGSEVTVEVQGSGFDAPTGLYFSHTGIKAELIAADAPKDEKDKDKDKGKKRSGDGKALKFKVTVA